MIYLYIILLLLFTGCDSLSNKKVFTSFDTIEGTHSDNVQRDDARWSGGPGFEDIAELISWKTNNAINIIGDANAIKGDTIVFKAGDVFPNTLRAFGKEISVQCGSYEKEGFPIFIRGVLWSFESIT